MIKNFLGVVALSTICVAVSLYSPGDYIVDLTDSNFKMIVEQDNTTFWMVEFYSGFCGHCKKFAPEYKKVAKALHGVLKIGAVNVDEYRYLSTNFRIKRYPTILVFGKDKQLFAQYHGKDNAKDVIAFGIAAAT